MSLDEIGIETEPTLSFANLYRCIDRLRFSYARSVFLTKYSTASCIQVKSNSNENLINQRKFSDKIVKNTFVTSYSENI